MEPITAAAIIAKILASTYNLCQAVQGKGVDFEKDLKAYESLVELGGQLGNWLPKDASAKDSAQALALLTAAFGKTFHECFGAFHAFDDKSRLQSNLTAAVEWAQPSRPPESKKPPLSLSKLLSDPDKTPYFSSLWAAFTKPNLPGKAGRGDIPNFPEPLIDNPRGEARSRFEQTFRRNVRELLASPGARDLSLAVLRMDDSAERARWVERLLVADMATWHERHVFGNVRGHETLPAMPLGSMYVEPQAKRRRRHADGAHTGSVPILTAVRDALAKKTLVVVTADFGHGKSLTARTLAYQTARTFLDDGSKPSSELERPVFVKCQAAFSTSSIELAQAVRRAQWLTLKDELEIEELAESDEALSPPSNGQSTLFLLDGLDEVAFLERDCLSFFEKLRGQLTSRHRAIVFSRPHSLPTEKLAEWGVPVLELQPFDTSGDDLGQAGQWLNRWNQCSRRPEILPSALQTDGLVDLARTPILLFMMAYTWGDLNTLYSDWLPPETANGRQEDRTVNLPISTTEAIWDRKHRIYEAFFRAIAWGKYERDREGHPAIKNAARALSETLESLSLIEAASTNHDLGQRALEPEVLTRSMLWLMGRVAWLSRYLQQQPKPKALTRSQVERLLEDELDLDDPKVTEVVRDGLLLAMQADLSESSRPILFGHESFREFLVARCWSELLRVIVALHTKVELKDRLIKILREGHLREGDDRSFDFLRARLRQWPVSDRERLYSWALAEFENETIEERSSTLQGDTRRDFRCTALALASAVAPQTGLLLRDHRFLRSLLASYWIAKIPCPLWAERLEAEGLHMPGSQIPSAKLLGANLTGANLAGANLAGANLVRADLSSACLSGANLNGARLEWANLVGAQLSVANLSEANLFEADLFGADLSGANLDAAHLHGANLTGASLHEAGLSGANLSDALLDEDGYQIAVSRGAVVDETTRIVPRPSQEAS